MQPKTFQYPKLTSLQRSATMIFFILAFGLYVVSFLLETDFEKEDLLSFVISLALALPAVGFVYLQLSKKIQQSFVVDDYGITQKRGEVMSKMVTWEEVARIKESDGRIKLLSEDQKELMVLPLGLDNFEELRGILHEHVFEKSENHSNLPSVFHANSGRYVIFVIGTSFLLTMNWLEPQMEAWIIGLLIIGFTAPLFIMPTRVTLTEESVILKYILWKKVIFYSDIQDVSIKVNATREGDHYSTVSLLLNTGKKNHLSGLKDGNNLFHSLKQKLPEKSHVQ